MSTRRQRVKRTNDSGDGNAMRRRSKTGAPTGKPKKGPGEESLPAESWSDEDWDLWIAQLDAPQRPVALSELVPKKAQLPLKWAIPDAYDDLPPESLLKQLFRLTARPKSSIADIAERSQSWILAVEDREPDTLFALECLAWCHLLPRLGRELGREPWCRLLDQLRDVTRSAAGLSLADDPLTHQLLNGELPWTMAYLLPEIGTLDGYAESAVRALSRGAVELLDGQGLPGARHMPQMRSLLACWTRCQLMASQGDLNCMDSDAQSQYEWMIRQSLRTARPDGSPMFSAQHNGQPHDDLFVAAIACGGDSIDREIARYVIPGQKAAKKHRKAEKLPAPHVYSEWSEACVMRSSWKRKSSCLAVLFDNRSLRTELSIGGQLIASGDWNPHIDVNGRRLKARSDWRELCWYTDDDAEYLELEIDLENDWRIQRQMLLGRTDSLLFVADVVLGPTSAKIDYESSIALAPDIEFRREQETRDGLLGHGKVWSVVFPLALSEWESSPTIGVLEAEENRLVLRQSVVGSAMYAPLFFDYSKQRISKERTWRQLTIAEQLITQPPNVAVGYRVQSWRTQWLIYRSLAAKANRTLLGQNTSDEFVFGQFTAGGELKAMIEVE